MRSYCTVLHSPVQSNPVQCSAALYSTVQYRASIGEGKPRLNCPASKVFPEEISRNQVMILDTCIMIMQYPVQYSESTKQHHTIAQIRVSSVILNLSYNTIKTKQKTGILQSFSSLYDIVPE